MHSPINRIITFQFSHVMPSVIVIMLVVAARFMGMLQATERVAFDYLLKSRPAEPTDERILIVEVNEEDIRAVGTYPIPDERLANLILTLQSSSPSVIGFDFFRDLSVGDSSNLAKIFESSPNVIGIDRIAFLAQNQDAGIASPAALPPERVGFVNAILDEDGYLRRSLLGSSDSKRNYKFSFTIRLTETYLFLYGLTLENGIHDPQAMRFGTTEIPRFHPNTGGYVRADAGGTQTLLNVRSGKEPFQIVSFTDVETGKVPLGLIRNRIVLIGPTAMSTGDFLSSAATQSQNPALNSGVEMQAHAVSQLVSAVLDDRPLLRSWAEFWEYIWIIGWGIVGLIAGTAFSSSLKILISVLAGVSTLVSISYVAIVLGWWIPLVPPLLVLTFNGAMLAISRFYQYEQSLKDRLQERQLTLEHIFDALHNGPLQSISGMLRQARERGDESFLDNLEVLNRELRSVYESIRHEVVDQDNRCYVNSQFSVDLNQPLNEVLYEIYNHTLTRNLPHFQRIKIKVVTFEAIDSQSLSVEQKRSVCRFLEEALCNVGRHAIGTTRLTVICKTEGEMNRIFVQDNGSFSLARASEGRGTQQAKDLAGQLGGKFRRSIADGGGAVCELCWPANRRSLVRFFRSPS
jgi:CHASE2 domain-containing sensor protein/two-component sensor histidine kinase